MDLASQRGNELYDIQIISVDFYEGLPIWQHTLTVLVGSNTI